MLGLTASALRTKPHCRVLNKRERRVTSCPIDLKAVDAQVSNVDLSLASAWELRRLREKIVLAGLSWVLLGWVLQHQVDPASGMVVETSGPLCVPDQLCLLHTIVCLVTSTLSLPAHPSVWMSCPVQQLYHLVSLCARIDEHMTCTSPSSLSPEPCALWIWKTDGILTSWKLTDVDSDVLKIDGILTSGILMGFQRLGGWRDRYVVCGDHPSSALPLRLWPWCPGATSVLVGSNIDHHWITRLLKGLCLFQTRVCRRVRGMLRTLAVILVT